MKKLFIIIMFLSIMVIGCNKNPIVLNQSEVKDISYHYFDKIYSHAMYFGKVSKTLNEIDSSDNPKLKELINYMDGYNDGVGRVALYKDIEKVVFDETMSTFYDNEMLYDTKTVLTDLDILVFQLYKYLEEKSLQSFDIARIKQLSNHLDTLSRNIYPSNKNPSQKDLTLYNMFVNPKIIMNNYSSEEMHQKVKVILITIEKINSDIQEK